ncbi:SDR family NAD(P)-dependent oxidoreductase [Variovorax sp. ZT5P49]|uniref:SDR family NAD(P)-dependent oxidoreductase n=1 Tax=Variovorax sp. ZT5P49 TaxID=3443733 RepID=UPI003F47F3E8
MNLELKGKVVLITGGSKGIGLATAKAFCEEGARVIVCGRGRDALDAAAAALRGIQASTVDVVVADVTVPQQIVLLAEHVRRQYGQLDVLINNAGYGMYKPFAEVSMDDLQKGMAVNFFAPFLVTQTLLPLLRAGRYPCVVNIAGRTGTRGNYPPGSSCTGPAKAAEIRFSIDLAAELAEFGIRVNCVVAGVVMIEDRLKTWEKGAQQRGATSEELSHFAERMASQGWGTAEEVADVITFLSSRRSSYVNGAALAVDGGPHTKSFFDAVHDHVQEFRLGAKT